MSADTGLLLQAVISIAVILVVLLAAALAFVLCRRGSGHGRGFLTRVHSPCRAGCFVPWFMIHQNILAGQLPIVVSREYIARAAGKMCGRMLRTNYPAVCGLRHLHLVQYR